MIWTSIFMAPSRRGIRSVVPSLNRQSSRRNQTLYDNLFAVLGPRLWNIFCRDALVILRTLGYIEVGFADDLNVFKPFLRDISNDVIQDVWNTAQVELHSWGAANGVSFDPTKESFPVLSRRRPFGACFEYWVWILPQSGDEYCSR